MSVETTIAVIAGCFSLLVSMISIGYSHVTRLRTIRVEEFGKQDEHIRIKALTAIEEVTFALGGIGVLVNSMGIAISHKLFPTSEQFTAHFDPMLNDYRKKLGEAHHRYIVYLTTDISNEILDIEQQFTTIHLDVLKLNNLAAQIQDAIGKIRLFTNQKYLSLAGKITNS